MTDPFAPQPPPEGGHAPPYAGDPTPPPAASGAYTPPTSYAATPYDVHGQPGQWPGQHTPGLQPQGTDGVAIAALVTGILMTGPIALILGIVGLRRVNRSGRGGQGMAIAGIVLGAVSIVLGIALGVLAWLGLSAIESGEVDLDMPGLTSGHAYGDDPGLDALWDACEAGDMGACDDLYMESAFGSEYEEFGDTCGGRTSGAEFCETLD